MVPVPRLKGGIHKVRTQVKEEGGSNRKRTSIVCMKSFYFKNA